MPGAHDQDRTDRQAPVGAGRADEVRGYSEAILSAMRQPMLVLSGDLRVETANGAFYRTFDIGEANIRGRLVYELGDGQWDIPALRELLEGILPNNGAVDDFRVEHEFERIGRRVMVLNAHRMERADGPDTISLQSRTLRSGNTRDGCSRAKRNSPRRSSMLRAMRC